MDGGVGGLRVAEHHYFSDGISVVEDESLAKQKSGDIHIGEQLGADTGADEVLDDYSHACGWSRGCAAAGHGTDCDVFGDSLRAAEGV